MVVYKNKFLKKIVLCFFLPIIYNIAIAQDVPVQFSYTTKQGAANEQILQIKAVANKGVKIFSKTLNAAEANTSITFDSSGKKYLIDSVAEIGTGGVLQNADLKEYNITAYDSVIWEQKFNVAIGDTLKAKWNINYYYIGADGVPQSLEEKDDKQLIGASIKNNNTKEGVNNVANSKGDLKSKSLWGLLIAGILAGLIGFITPCVYALVPVTVSMFLKRSKTKQEGRRNVFAYAIFIVAIYTIVGLLSGILWSNDDLQRLSANWIFNIIIFILFVVFGLSFLGAFEISLPASWANKMDSKASSKSFVGIFFMALTLVIVSFSCTGNFVASLLAGGFSQGKLGPATGLFGFGLGLAAPFAIFAVFPNLISVLTKSGGWQNALKVTIGFVELAASLKFLSQADLVKNWRILDREVFLVIWIVIFVLLAFYLLGKIRFKHDSELPKNDWGLEYIPVPRLLLAMTALGFAIYLIPGLWGAPLKAISGFAPPMGTQDFNLNKSNGATHNSGNTISLAPLPNKYVSSLKAKESAEAQKSDLTVYYDYNEALAAAKILKKPLLLDITGITCVNCRKFEGAIWPDAAVNTAMKNDFVIASLFLDAPDELNDVEKFDSKLLGRKVKTLGDLNKHLALELVGVETMPNYVFVDIDGKLLHNEGYGYEPSESASAFVKHLEMVKNEFKKRNP